MQGRSAADVAAECKDEAFMAARAHRIIHRLAPLLGRENVQAIRRDFGFEFHCFGEKPAHVVAEALHAPLELGWVCATPTKSGTIESDGMKFHFIVFCTREVHYNECKVIRAKRKNMGGWRWAKLTFHELVLSEHPQPMDDDREQIKRRLWNMAKSYQRDRSKFHAYVFVDTF